MGQTECFSSEISFTREKLSENSNKEKLEEFLRFIPNAKNALVVKTPIIDLIVRYLWNNRKNDNDYIFHLCTVLWKNNFYYEERKVAIRLLSKTVKKQPDKVMQLVEEWKKDISTWDLCDQLGMNCSGRCLLISFDLYINPLIEWAKDENFWVRRLPLASISQLRKLTLNNNQWKLIKKILDAIWLDEEYYVIKGLSWALKELSKSNSNYVTNFLLSKIEENAKQSPLFRKKSYIKESIRKLPPEDQEQILLHLKSQTKG